MDYPLLNAFWTMCMFFLWVLWFVLLFRIIGDIFRDDTLGGWGKAGWMIFVVILPFLGVFVYLIARGRGMGARMEARMNQNEQQFQTYIRDVAAAPGSSTSDELAKLAVLKNNGDITEEDYQRAKHKVLA